MSTDERDQLAAQLRETERGEAASWVTYPPTPGWWPFLFGAWTFLYAVAVGWLSGLLQAGAMLALVLVMGVVLGWDRRRRGTFPTGRAPREIKRIMTVFFATCIVVAATCWLVGETIGVLPAAVLAAALMTVVVHRYEAAYARAAAAVRDRLDPERLG